MALLEIPGSIWADLIAHLRHASSGVRESGAFLIGEERRPRRASAFLPYEELQADALNDDYIELRPESFSKLWARCRRYCCGVVADIHTHRLDALQSKSDRQNPMIAVPGHLALIVPEFAQHDVTPDDIGVYVYEGAHRWTDCSHEDGAIVITDERPQ